jgi:TonB family protein
MNSERRRSIRTQLDRILYIRIEPNNGAVVMGLSEDGLSFQAVAPVYPYGQVHLWFSSATKGRLKVCGELEWIDETKKRGGLSFLQPTEDVRQYVRELLAQSATATEHQLTSTPGVASTKITNKWSRMTAGQARSPAQSAPGIFPEVINNSTTVPRHDEPAPSQFDMLPRSSLYELREPEVAYRNLQVRRARVRRQQYCRGLLTGIALSVLTVAGIFTLRAYQRQLGNVRNSRSEPRVSAKGSPPGAEFGDVLVSDARAKDHEGLGLAARENIDRPPTGVTAGSSSPPAKIPPSQGAKDLAPPPRQNSAAFSLSLGHPKAVPEVRAERQSGSPPAITELSRAINIQSKPPEPQPILQGSVTVSLGTYPSIRVPPEIRSQAVGAKLQVGQLVSRVDPVYPEDAERQGIEGIVKLHATIGTDGFVRNVQVASGPALLVPAAVSAIRRWRYRPTLLAEQPVETGRDVNIVFRLDYFQ